MMKMVFADLDVIIILYGGGELLSPQWTGEAGGDQLGDLLQLGQLGCWQFYGRRGLADLVEASVVLTVLHEVLGEVHAGVLALHGADLLPDLVAACPLLERQGQVEVVPLRPDDESLLLFLVCGVWLDSRLQQHRAVGLRPDHQGDSLEPLHVGAADMAGALVVPLSLSVQLVELHPPASVRHLGEENLSEQFTVILTQEPRHIQCYFDFRTVFR